MQVFFELSCECIHNLRFRSIAQGLSAFQDVGEREEKGERESAEGDREGKYEKRENI